MVSMRRRPSGSWYWTHVLTGLGDDIAPLSAGITARAAARRGGTLPLESDGYRGLDVYGGVELRRAAVDRTR
jgi:hypothetical protein